MSSNPKPTKPLFAYIAFDVYPSTKGASTHITHCLKALLQTYKFGVLICLGTEQMPKLSFDKETGLYIFRFTQKIANFLHRTELFQHEVFQFLQHELNTELKLIHFRDIHGGLPTVQFLRDKKIKSIYEVNAMPHIELPYRYPNISATVLQKLKHQFDLCVEQVDQIITPSLVTYRKLKSDFNLKIEQIKLIHNGVQIYSPVSQQKIETPYIIYFGALQKWQGIKTLFKALKELMDLEVKLLICSSVSKKRSEIYYQIAEDYGITSKIVWKHELDKAQLAYYISNAYCSVAPLTSCDRNIIQGCHPLKVLESMAYGTPVVASDLEVVSKVVLHLENGILVRPDAPELFGRAIRALFLDPVLRDRLGENSRKLILKNYLWVDQEKLMHQVYTQLNV